jgi:hypothetical protein
VTKLIETGGIDDGPSGDEALKLALARWRHRPEKLAGPVEDVVLTELGRIRRIVDGLEQLILARLIHNLESKFDEEELRTLCFNLSLDYDDLQGAGRVAHVRGLVGYCSRHGRIGELIDELQRLRPGLNM